MGHLSIAIVGPGRLGTALAISLTNSGYRIEEIVLRRERKSSASARAVAKKVGARSTQSESARLDADLVWFCVPDSNITEAARELSDRNWKSRVAIHSSGVLTSDALAALRKRGASVASVHPLMTFVRGSVPDLSGVMFAVEGDARAVRVVSTIVRDLGGETVLVKKEAKPAYHAFTTMICPLLLALLASAERVAGFAGITPPNARRRMLPIIQETLRNYVRLGPEKAFTGPIVRGDLDTIRLHLKALSLLPSAKNGYITLALAAIEYLPSRNRKQLKAMLYEANY